VRIRISGERIVVRFGFGFAGGTPDQGQRQWPEIQR